MIRLKTGEHFGVNRTKLQMQDCVMVEAGCNQHNVVPWHYHENAYFYYHIQGHLEEINKKKNYTCVPGTALFHYWNEPHYNTEFSDDALFYHLEFKKDWFDKYGVKINVLEGDFQLNAAADKTLFRKIYDEFKVGDTSSVLAIDGLSLQIFASMIRFSSVEKFRAPAWVAKVRELIKDCKENNITLQLLSQETGLHPVYLSREFPRFFHMGFGEYIRQNKLEQATILLRTTELLITEIAFQCGFSDQSHFIRLFREQNKVTPLQYRKFIKTKK